MACIQFLANLVLEGDLVWGLEEVSGSLAVVHPELKRDLVWRLDEVFDSRAVVHLVHVVELASEQGTISDGLTLLEQNNLEHSHSLLEEEEISSSRQCSLSANSGDNHISKFFLLGHVSCLEVPMELILEKVVPFLMDTPCCLRSSSESELSDDFRL